MSEALLWIMGLQLRPDIGACALIALALVALWQAITPGRPQ